MPFPVKVLVLLVLLVIALVVYGRVLGRSDKENHRLPGVTQAVREKVSGELRAGRKISAIKVYRQATGAPLADAKRAIDTWFVPGRGPGVIDAVHDASSGRLTAEGRRRISDLVRRGDTAGAEDLYAEATGATRTEARAIIRTWDTEAHW